MASFPFYQHATEIVSHDLKVMVTETPAKAEPDLKKLVEAYPKNSEVNEWFVLSLIKQGTPEKIEEALKTSSDLYYAGKYIKDREQYTASYLLALEAAHQNNNHGLIVEEQEKYKASGFVDSKMENYISALLSTDIDDPLEMALGIETGEMIGRLEPTEAWENLIRLAEKNYPDSPVVNKIYLLCRPGLGSVPKYPKKVGEEPALEG